MTGFMELRTSRLLLRPYRLTDADDVYEYAKDPEFARDLTDAFPRPYERSHADEFVAGRLLASWDTNPTFAIVLEGKVIGGINLRIDKKRGTAGMGYAIAREHWGKGITLEVGRSVIAQAFQQYGLRKVWAKCDVENQRSRRVMEKLGMVHEGTMQADETVNDEPRDSHYYGLLREKWRAGEQDQH